MLPLTKIEQLIKRCDSRNDPVHDSSHLRRVAEGAAWFVKVAGGNSTEQQAAYIAGLLHDIVRPLTNKAGHEVASARVAARVLKALKFEAEIASQIVTAIADHGGTRSWNSTLHEAVFFADKVFEQMGALVLFRRCTWVGECADTHQTTVLASVAQQFAIKLKKYRPTAFARPFRQLVAAQYTWPMQFLKALRAGEGWALYMATAGFCNGALDRLPIDKFVRNFIPIAEQDAAARTEALKYLRGEKWLEWAVLIRR